MRFALPQVLLVGLMMAGVSAAQQSNSPRQPPKQQQSTPPAAATDDNSFPEDLSRKAAETAKQPPAAQPNVPEPPAAVTPPTSGESSSNGGFQAPADDEETAPTNPERRKLRLNDESAIGTPHADRIASKDEEIADMYVKDGNYQGALNRYKDALHFVPDDETAALGIAECARKIGKRDESLAAYQTYLRLAPQGKKAKQARKAIEELSAGEKR